MTPVLMLHFAVTWMLVGLIWVIQLLTYPQFQLAGRPGFTGYHFSHCLRIGLIIAPLLLLEVTSACWLIWHDHWGGLAMKTSAALIVVNWLSTAVFQAPIHTRLMRGYDEVLVRRLILTNWLRTLTWSLRGLLVAWSIIG